MQNICYLSHFLDMDDEELTINQLIRLDIPELINDIQRVDVDGDTEGGGGGAEEEDSAEEEDHDYDGEEEAENIDEGVECDDDRSDDGSALSIASAADLNMSCEALFSQGMDGQRKYSSAIDVFDCFQTIRRDKG